MVRGLRGFKNAVFPLACMLLMALGGMAPAAAQLPSCVGAGCTELPPPPPPVDALAPVVQLVEDAANEGPLTCNLDPGSLGNCDRHSYLDACTGTPPTYTAGTDDIVIDGNAAVLASPYWVEGDGTADFPAVLDLGCFSKTLELTNLSIHVVLDGATLWGDARTVLDVHDTTGLVTVRNFQVGLAVTLMTVENAAVTLEHTPGAALAVGGAIGTAIDSNLTITGVGWWGISGGLQASNSIVQIINSDLQADSNFCTALVSQDLPTRQMPIVPWSAVRAAVDFAHTTAGGPQAAWTRIDGAISAAQTAYTSALQSPAAQSISPTEIPYSDTPSVTLISTTGSTLTVLGSNLAGSKITIQTQGGFLELVANGIACGMWGVVADGTTIVSIMSGFDRLAIPYKLANIDDALPQMLFGDPLASPLPCQRGDAVSTVESDDCKDPCDLQVPVVASLVELTAYVTCQITQDDPGNDWPNIVNPPGQFPDCNWPSDAIGCAQQVTDWGTEGIDSAFIETPPEWDVESGSSQCNQSHMAVEADVRTFAGDVEYEAGACTNHNSPPNYLNWSPPLVPFLSVCDGFRVVSPPVMISDNRMSLVAPQFADGVPLHGSGLNSLSLVLKSLENTVMLPDNINLIAAQAGTASGCSPGLITLPAVYVSGSQPQPLWTLLDGEGIPRCLALCGTDKQVNVQGIVNVPLVDPNLRVVHFLVGGLPHLSGFFNVVLTSNCGHGFRYPSNAPPGVPTFKYYFGEDCEGWANELLTDCASIKPLGEKEKMFVFHRTVVGCGAVLGKAMDNPTDHHIRYGSDTAIDVTATNSPGTLFVYLAPSQGTDYGKFIIANSHDALSLAVSVATPGMNAHFSLTGDADQKIKSATYCVDMSNIPLTVNYQPMAFKGDLEALIAELTPALPRCVGTTGFPVLAAHADGPSGNEQFTLDLTTIDGPKKLTIEDGTTKAHVRLDGLDTFASFGMKLVRGSTSVEAIIVPDDDLFGVILDVDTDPLGPVVDYDIPEEYRGSETYAQQFDVTGKVLGGVVTVKLDYPVKFKATAGDAHALFQFIAVDLVTRDPAGFKVTGIQGLGVEGNGVNDLQLTREGTVFKFHRLNLDLRGTITITTQDGAALTSSRLEYANHVTCSNSLTSGWEACDYVGGEYYHQECTGWMYKSMVDPPGLPDRAIVYGSGESTGLLQPSLYVTIVGTAHAPLSPTPLCVAYSG